MRERLLKIVFSHSVASLGFSCSSKPRTVPPQLHSFKISLQNFYFTFIRFGTTSSPDNLNGLIDPNCGFLENEPPSQENLRVKSVSEEEFAFLRDSLYSSGIDSIFMEPQIESGKCLSDASLISNFIRNNNDGFGDKTQEFLRQYREKLNESLVVDVLNLLKIPELGVKFFIWAGRQIGYRHTGPVYHALLEMLGGDKNDRVPEHFLKEIRGEDEDVLEKLLNVLIRKCCRHGLWNAALEELGRLKDFGYKPSRMTYNTLIQVFLEADRLGTASLVYREMSDAGLNMDGFTLGCFLHSLCKRGRWREALELIEKEDFVPDTVIYTKMISGLCEASLFEEAMDFLNKMRSSSCIPNVITYRILLCGCLRKGKLGRCKRILSMMITEGCYPSSKIFNSLVHAYCRSGEYSYAYKLLKKMVNCGCQPGYVVYNIFVGGICGNEELPRSDLLELAEKTYSEMLDAGIVLNKVNVSNFIRCLCGAGKFEKAYKVIQEMMSKGFIPDCSTYTKVIGFLCNASKVEKAFLLFEEMKRSGITPDIFTYTILIDNFCKAGLIQQARKWFDEMSRDGCAPNVVTYTALIHAYLKARKLSTANELFEMMLLAGCVPNVVTYTALIDGHCKAGDIEKACQIYDKMRGNVEIQDVDMYFKSDESNAREPNVYTYGALVDGLCKAHKVEEARDLLDTMVAEDCEPNHIVYDALIDGFCKVGKLDEAQEVFIKMSERGYGPNVFTYSSLINRMFKDKRLDLALKVLSKMLENSCPPNVIVYTEMIDGLCKVGKTDEAHKLMLMMEEKGCHPNVVTYTAMIDGLGKAGKVDRCLELFGKMGTKGCAPNFVTYRVLINHCCVAGLLDEAHELLEEMKQTYWPRHIAGYRKVIEGFNREFIISLGLLDDIIENDKVPIIPVYRVLIDCFCKAGRLERAVELHKEISSSTPFSRASKNMFSSLIESLSAASKVDKAFALYADMISRGGIPELSTFFQLIKGLNKANMWEEAIHLADSICQTGINWIPEEETSEGT
ncbi:pentatricopeptide repeat-containing protein At1g06710, mitochondrial [Malania oleifera]|uniref:pentatricopeptide repeat-containing protein At1g06710, mitochondrial n=1 Tax=Malania oleifera TaxID=397392 RepID=UPI0025ADC9CE|nr:pentatricopeptide repeat-containing protein At1g06710, mitochondrial [Malania oleifera]XP_057959916.1 pentatricopeptide repeat-containing protein At1g06710, mitochondrial [Malania oleifera]XP_057959917.1 pentatricopeptide repeat-containing protein At1g06710, mitochondrial [Malania oleifera]XP_057959918.1 pentatricopeptide repeat-containing protein At1g06710, mitochondrial [Malania oleifera]XP_057959919.1 pentatricopeptide repeat-containing protein At1g06710, mitochondrial [Malania oleifera]